MEAIRRIVDADVLASVIDLPANMKNCKVEVIVMPASESVTTDTTKRTAQSMLGFLHAYANPALIEQEKGAWERTATEKHGRI